MMEATNTKRKNRLISLLASVAILAIAPIGVLSQNIAIAQEQSTQQNTLPNMSTGPASVADLAETLLGAVVNISISQSIDTKGSRNPPPDSQDQPFRDYFDDFFNDQENNQPPRQVNSQGSGFVIDPDGIIVTNNHVIADADQIEVIFSDGRKLEAELLGTDPKTDLAVLKVTSDTPLPSVPIGDSKQMRIGDWVMAIGNPFGLGGSVTVGIISAIGRDINSGPYDNFIQTDAAINRGNSGGPLFNMNGEVIGINTAIISPSGGSIGIGFSVPTELASNVINQLREFGETRRGWLGVRIQNVTEDIAESMAMESAKGALIAGIIPDGPVDDGSLIAGDIILSFDGKEVKSARDLPRIVAESPVGKEVDVQVFRKGEIQDTKVTLGRLEDGEKLIAEAETITDGDEEREIIELLNMELSELSDALRDEFEIAQAVEGVVITAVDQGSQASEIGLRPGDVIVEISQEAVTLPSEVADILEQSKEQDRRNALLMIANKMGENRFVTLRIKN